MDLYHWIKKVVGIAPGTYKSGANPTSVVIDRGGDNQAHDVLLELHIGAVTDDQTLTLVDGATSSPTDAVVAADVIGGATVLAAFKAIAGADAGTIKTLQYTGTKRYLKVGSTGAGGTGATYGVTATFANSRKGPATS
jgi:hypothetical protein